MVKEGSTDYLCSYPIEFYKELTVGTHKIDFWNGEVTLADGTKETTSVALRDTDFDRFRSLFIYTEHKIKIVTPHIGNLLLYVNPVTISLMNTEFDKLDITTYRLTNFGLYAHTDPYGIPRIEMASYIENIPYILRSAVASAGNKDEINIRAQLGRDATGGFIMNMGNTGGDLHIWEYDGINWTSDYNTIGPDGVINYSNVSIQKIRIDATIDNTQYEVHLR